LLGVHDLRRVVGIVVAPVIVGRVVIGLAVIVEVVIFGGVVVNYRLVVVIIRTAAARAKNGDPKDRRQE
jgi:hypothetical protein